MVIEIHKMTLIHFKQGVTMRHVFTILYILSVFIIAVCGTKNSKLVGFTKKIDVFGIQIVATETTPDDKMLHAANVMAEYIDNNEDGIPDNPKVVEALVSRKVMLIMAWDEDELRSINEKNEPDLLPAGPSPFQSLFAVETRPDAVSQGIFDSAWEEILHPITDVGYANAYPEVFGVKSGTEVAKVMDRARGGHFIEVPERYPEDAWFTYYDETCGYGCQIAEYVYWALTSILGAQDFPGRLEQIENEWGLNTAEKVKINDLHIYTLLTDPRYKFPTVLPDGHYSPKVFKIQKYP